MQPTAPLDTDKDLFADTIQDALEGGASGTSQLTFRQVIN